MMKANSRAILCATVDVSDGDEGNFVEWHSREHLIERIAIPGFLRGRRLSRENASPKYLIIYDVEDLSVLSRKEYLDRLNSPSEWTRVTLPTFIGGVRGAYRVVSRQGNTEGGFVLLLRFLPRNPISAKQLFEHLIMNEWCRDSGLTSVYLAEPDRFSSTLDTEEAQVSRNAFREEWTLIAEGISKQHLVTFYEKNIRRDKMEEIGISTSLEPDIFSLQAAVCSCSV